MVGDSKVKWPVAAYVHKEILSSPSAGSEFIMEARNIQTLRNYRPVIPYR
jgi:hypothetical protein